MPTLPLPTGYVIYRGPSRIDGAPIMAIAIVESDNRKTGNVVQTYIMRSDVAPIDAVKFGLDVSICGPCPHRGNKRRGQKRTCYVTLSQGPSIVWRTYQRGRYPDATRLDSIAIIGKDRVVRLGAYGDPAAVPSEVWRALISRAAGHTGYSHQWRAPHLRDTLEFCQASVDSVKDIETLERIHPGQAYFRVLPLGSAPSDGEVMCPSLKGVQCIDCQLCDGKSGLRIAIPAHGPARNFVQ